MNIYVGNLPYSATSEDLREAFGEFGNVTSASIIMDKVTGRARGFGFVEMENDEDGARAIEEMNGRDWMGRTLTVNEAKPRERSFGGGGGGGPRREYGGGGESRGGHYEPSRSYSGDSGGRSSSGGGGGDRFDRSRRGPGGPGGSRGGNDRRERRGYDDRRWETGGDDDD